MFFAALAFRKWYRMRYRFRDSSHGTRPSRDEVWGGPSVCIDLACCRNAALAVAAVASITASGVAVSFDPILCQ